MSRPASPLSVQSKTVSHPSPLPLDHSVENDAHPKVQLEVPGGKAPNLLDFGLVRYGVDARATLKVTNVSQVRVRC